MKKVINAKSGRGFLLLCAALFGILLVVAGCQQDSSSGETEVQSTKATESDATTAKLPTLAPTAEPPAEPTATNQPPTPTTEQTTALPTPSETEELTPEATAAQTTATPEPEIDLAELELPEGALISVQMESQAGVLLDALPEEQRETAVDSLISKPDSFWEDLAWRQVRLTKRRLNFRNFVYDNKGQLPLPPEELWDFQVDPAGPRRVNIDGHDLVVIDYSFTSTLLTDAESPGKSEPALSEEGGKWNEPFILPVDPDLLLQRTGNACVNEAGFPPNSFDTENVFAFFDYTCQGDSGGVLGCHRTRLHPQSCLEALTTHVGTTETEMRFERIEWDDELASEVRIGQLTQTTGPDLMVVGSDLENYRITYRYFPADSCALVEQCVNDSGWRRLLQFNATVQNVGAETLFIGPVVSANPVSTLFQYNACHAHYHFADYGDFYFSSEEENISSKQAFCVESTNRFSNNEFAPLTHPYTCRFQGVQAGWVDEYLAGLDCQWIDVTDVPVEPEGTTYSLGLTSNPDGFLCEGALVRDENENLVWEESGLTNEDGSPILRPQCEFVPDWDVNNDESRDLTVLPVGGFVTEPCVNGELDPRRNCGFQPQLEGVEMPPEADQNGTPQSEPESPPGAFSCNPGDAVQMTCSIEEPSTPQILRICDYSSQLETGVACVFGDALANELLTESTVQFDFACPLARDEAEEGGLFSLYTAALFETDDRQTVSCRIE